ncbi:MAG: PKD domain-containing protein [Solirubrobacteraceae bacterium]
MTAPSTKLLPLLAALALLAIAQPAAAQVQPAGLGEPLFTSSQQNTQWFEWPATSSADAYRIQYSYYEDNALVANPTYTAANGGSGWANWSGVRALQHGHQYGICAQGQYSLPNDSLFFPDGPNSCSMGSILGRRAYTTIDRSKPTAAITLAGGATYTNSASVAVRTDFSDDVAGPFPANFLCFQYGGGDTNVCDAQAGFVYGYNAACSVPAGGGTSTSFTCTADFGSGPSPAPDGPVWACVVAADASIPDNPSSADQRQSAEKANLSSPACDKVILDRAAPSVQIAASSTSVTVGDLVSFDVQAADAGSGLGGSYAWTWGDNTAAGAGASATHTFTQAGTYEVRVATADAAGNAATATRVVTVATRAASDGGSTASGGAGGGATGGSSPAGAAAQTTVIQQAGGTANTQTRAVGGALQVLAPRRLALRRRAGRSRSR